MFKTLPVYADTEVLPWKGGCFGSVNSKKGSVKEVFSLADDIEVTLEGKISAQIKYDKYLLSFL